MAAVGYRKDVRGVPFARASRTPAVTFAIAVVPTTATVAYADALSLGTTTTIVGSLLLLQQPIVSREHTRRDRYVRCLSPALVLLGRKMAVVTRVHGENSNLLVPRAGSDVIQALLRAVGVRPRVRSYVWRREGARARGGGERRAWVGGGGVTTLSGEDQGAEVRTRSKEK